MFWYFHYKLVTGRPSICGKQRLINKDTRTTWLMNKPKIQKLSADEAFGERSFRVRLVNLCSWGVCQLGIANVEITLIVVIYMDGWKDTALQSQR